MINNFTHAEENAVMVAVFWILDADSKWAANEKNYYFGLATKFGWTQQDLVSSSSMSQTTAKSVISNMPSDKRRLVTFCASRKLPAPESGTPPFPPPAKA